MDVGTTLGSIRLQDQQSASTILYDILADAVDAFPGSLADVSLPGSPPAFRQQYVDFMPRFEAARLESPDRATIARRLATSMLEHVVWQDEHGSRSLAALLAEPTPPLPLTHYRSGGEPGWQPTISYRGQRWIGPQMAELATLLAGRNIITAAAAEALASVTRADNGIVRFPGRKIAILGAGAEMAPTRHWLQAGADVLWIDQAPPPEDWLRSERLAGSLYWPTASTDLLTRPREVLATILAFADGQPVDLCLYAYAPGQARELRLTGAMNAIVNALPSALVASVTLLVSPTTPTELNESDLAAMVRQRERRPMWQSVLANVGLLGRGDGAARSGRAAASRSVVGIQGTSYQSAQYLGKMIMAECWSAHGSPLSSVPHPFRVSANTAAITRTRSISHPVFTAAFGGAAAFQVETFTPPMSRCINGLLTVHDWMRNEPPIPGRIRVHGGIHTLPYPLAIALRSAAVIGFVRSPRLLRGLVQPRQ